MHYQYNTTRLEYFQCSFQTRKNNIIESIINAKRIRTQGNHFVLSNLKKILKELLDTRVLRNRHKYYVYFEQDL